MFHRGWFWLDTNSSLLAERVVDVTRHYGVVRTGPLSEAMVELAREPLRWAGIVTQVQGSLAPLETLRKHAPLVPVLAMVAHPDPALVNTLQARGIDLAVLPIDTPRITAFVQRSFTTSFLPDERVGRVVHELADRVALTPREVQIVSFCLGNEPRLRIRKRLGISENTLKSQVRGLLRKSGERNIDSLAKNILRAALLVDGSVKPAVPVAPWLPLAC